MWLQRLYISVQRLLSPHSRVLTAAVCGLPPLPLSGETYVLFPSLRAYLNGEAVHVCTVNSTGPNATTQVTGVSTPTVPQRDHMSRVPPAAPDPLALIPFITVVQHNILPYHTL